MAGQNMGKGRKEEFHLRRLQIKLFLAFIGIIIGTNLLLSLVILQRSSDAVQDKISTWIGVNNRQQVLNINSYIDKVEETAALFFSEDSYCEYDATDGDIEEFDKIKQETAITDRIEDLGVMNNFSDFGIIYANDHGLGWISNTTYAMFPEGNMYAAFAAEIGQEQASSAWVFGFEGNYDRMYYIKRLNDNAVLIAAIYNRELAMVFEYPDELKDMTIRLVDEKQKIIYSTNAGEIGENLESSLQKLIGKGSSFSDTMDKRLVTANICDNQWYVVASVPLEVVLKEIKQLRFYVLLFTLSVIILVLAIGVWVMRRITNPMDTAFSNLKKRAEYDALSGMLNKSSFQEMADTALGKGKQAGSSVMVIVDMDNFKQVNDKLGHAYGDKVIGRLGSVLNQMYGNEVVKGRIGGDEFALFMQYSFNDRDIVEKRVCSDLNLLLNLFSKEFEEEREICRVSLSAGVYIAQEGQESFEQMYKRADSALYVSKRGGKNRYTLYTDEMAGGENE